MLASGCSVRWRRPCGINVPLAHGTTRPEAKLGVIFMGVIRSHTVRTKAPARAMHLWRYAWG
jgi:hypothetical protein